MKGWTRSERAWFFGCAAFIPINIGFVLWNVMIGGTWNGFGAGFAFFATLSVAYSLRRQWQSVRRTVEIRANIVEMEARIEELRSGRKNGSVGHRHS